MCILHKKSVAILVIVGYNYEQGVIDSNVRKRKNKMAGECVIMATFPVNKIRNVCIMGHGGDGKTSLVESLLFTAGVTDRVGKVPDGNTVCDFDPEEIKRQFSISTAVAPVVWLSLIHI